MVADLAAAIEKVAMSNSFRSRMEPLQQD